MRKAELHLHCECGCDNFNVVMTPKEDNYELVCEDCGNSVARFSQYSVDWVGDGNGNTTH